MKKFAVLVALAVGLIAFRFEQAKWLVGYALRARVPVAERVPEIPPCPRCNLVLVSLDTLRADRLERMPNLNRIARKSVAFSHAYANAYFTTPSHMTLFTSLYPNTHRVESHRIPLRGQPGKRSPGNYGVLAQNTPTLAQVLAQMDYETIWRGPIHSKFLSLPQGFGRGFRKTGESAFGRGVDVGHLKAAAFERKSLSFSKTNPTFLFLHTYLPHIPYFLKTGPPLYTPDLLADFAGGIGQAKGLLIEQYDIPEADSILRECSRIEDLRPCVKKFSVDPFWHGVGSWQLTQLTKKFEQDTNERETVTLAYDSNIAELDRQISDLWEELEVQGRLEDTLVVFVSDHGQELFEHGTLFHNSFYEHTARVPLILYHPKIKSGIVSAQLTSLIDVMPALLEILQAKVEIQMQGHVPWKHKNDFVFGYSLGTDFVTDGEWKLIRAPSGQEELFHLQMDPAEHQNLIEFTNPWTFAAYKRLSAARRDWELSQAL